MLIPVPVLTEVRSISRRRDVLVDRLIASLGSPGYADLTVAIEDRAGFLRAIAQPGRRGLISAIDAQLVAVAEDRSFSVAVTILTTEPDDIGALVAATGRRLLRRRASERSERHRDRPAVDGGEHLTRIRLAWRCVVDVDRAPVERVSADPSVHATLVVGDLDAVGVGRRDQVEVHASPDRDEHDIAAFQSARVCDWRDRHTGAGPHLRPHRVASWPDHRLPAISEFGERVRGPRHPAISVVPCVYSQRDRV
jgi:hypothetical protein